ncbi:formate dehydrogenase major subunit [Burkholderiales bacterium]|nr:formate dehydrogenase major subunit [Burkholderiales bacterium]
MNGSDRRDLGTPSVPSAPMVELEIDGRQVKTPAGTSILRAAGEHGVMIPKLCATEHLKAFGSCRLCLVEIEGRRGYPASCTTPVEAGMKVRTQSDALRELRRKVMELYISDHPLDCLTCAANGACELQTMAGVVGLREVRYGDGRPGALANHYLEARRDASNPYFQFDPGKCIVCSRCVRSCEEQQGSFAISIAGRGFDAKVNAGQNEAFLASECVSCGACVAACPTAALVEKTVLEAGQPSGSIDTTCAYCGVGCMLHVQTQGERVVRVRPAKEGRANEGHACVKGRFAWGYATHAERITRPMLRENINDPWREVSWDEAIARVAGEFKRIQQTHGQSAIGAIVSSRCTNEEDYLVQKLVRAAFGNNNVDNCARVCHSPTGYGLKQTLGESAGTQAFASVAQADLILLIGANPSEAHPVFASRLKRRLREGAALIVIDPRAIELVAAPHVKAKHHLQLRPGTNVAVLNAMAHVIVTEGLVDEAFVAERCEAESFAAWRDFVAAAENAPENQQAASGVPASEVRAAASAYALAPNAAIYYGLGVTEHAQGSTAVIAIANLAMATGKLGREGVGVNPLRGQNNVQGSCDMGSFPHELPGYRHVSDAATRALFESAWGVAIEPEPGLRIPNMFDAALDGSFKGLYCQGEDPAQSEPNTRHVKEALAAMECVVVQDLFLSETAKFAHVFLPGSTFLEKDGTFTNAERRISRVRRVMAPRAGLADWEVTQALALALGYPMHYRHPSEIMDEIARLTPSFAGVSYAKLDALGSLQWPCNDAAPQGTPTMHVDAFVRGKGRFLLTQYLPTSEKVTRRFPLLLTTGRVLSQYNVGAQTRRTANTVFYASDVLEIHPHDAEERGITEGDRVQVESRMGSTTLPATLTEKVAPGVVYTTFHFPESGANFITTENSDWATNCPEYKVTAVEVSKRAQP